MSLRKLCISLAFVVVGCGGESGGGKGGTPTGGTQRTSSTRPKTRTANTPLAAETGCYKPEDEDLCAMAERIFELTNAKREGEGKPALVMLAGWSHVATEWSKGQADAAKIGHEGFPDARLSSYETEFGNDGMPQLAAENVGRISIGSDSVEEVATTFADGWYKSPGHHKNMMGDYQVIGVGVFLAEDGFFYATQIFAWAAE